MNQGPPEDKGKQKQFAYGKRDCALTPGMEKCSRWNPDRTETRLIIMRTLFACTE